MKHYLLPITLALILFGTIEGVTQKIIISGTVTDEMGSPLIGATVLIVGSTEGTVTDIDGQFSLEVEAGNYQLMVSYTGYESITQTVEATTARKNIDFSLTPGAPLEEVVVTGFSSSRRKRSKPSKLRKAKRPSVAYSSGESYAASPAAVSDKRIRSDKEAKAAGQLTAGEINDFSKWELWKDLKETELESFQEIWDIRPDQRYTLQLTNQDGYPIVDATAHLMDQGKPIWTSKTDNTGKAEFWAALFGSKNQSKTYDIQIEYQGHLLILEQAQIFQNGLNHYQIEAPCNLPNLTDVAFVVDATGSMGDEIAYLKAELEHVANRFAADNPDQTLRLGSVFYRDEGDAYVTKKHDLTRTYPKVVNFVRSQHADGGGDFPEAMDKALDVAINELSWSESATARILFLVMDAPPHQDTQTKKKVQQLCQQASRKGIKIVPVAGSGIDKSTEYLSRCLALTTNGTYVFLTDHSGIGNAHIEPTTDDYDVELLNELLLRLIQQYTTQRACEPIAFGPVSPANTTSNSKVDLLNCYPNPTDGVVYIDLPKNTQELFLTDEAGKILMSLDPSGQEKLEANLANFPSGTYFFKTEQKDQELIGKVILSRL